MTEARDIQYRQIGQHTIFHDLEVAAIGDLNYSAQHDTFECPNLVSFLLMAETEAKVLLEENPGHAFSIDFLAKLEELNLRYGKDLTHPMSATERVERFQAVLLYLRRIRMLKVAEREEQWHDVALEVEEKEERR
ncbi:MAG: hypothetical protein KIY12_07965 [Thermoplasmata archaeon]|uniref:Uncharacterized protein n=1 Tax=Candidatus Sysuiplasma superficiale TaxID=2823368 RepID=A0A8J7YPS3_9ARCH|nr:hypothetical protein [Candidatus Sysuiplasma superficiale]MBX8644638.1 hypothetical protein [Candidatus Sysuiplasma superficiale]